jgi:hypothetical protein
MAILLGCVGAEAVFAALIATVYIRWTKRQDKN